MTSMLVVYSGLDAIRILKDKNKVMRYLLKKMLWQAIPQQNCLIYFVCKKNQDNCECNHILAGTFSREK